MVTQIECTCAENGLGSRAGDRYGRLLGCLQPSDPCFNSPDPCCGRRCCGVTDPCDPICAQYSEACAPKCADGTHATTRPVLSDTGVVALQPECTCSQRGMVQCSDGTCKANSAQCLCAGLDAVEKTKTIFDVTLLAALSLAGLQTPPIHGCFACAFRGTITIAYPSASSHAWAHAAPPTGVALD